MIALHEHEAIESRTWLSTDIREDLPCLSVLDDHETQHATAEYDDDLVSALVPDAPTWEDTDTAEAPLEDAPTSALALEAGDPETDNLITQYFGEVRRFALLSFAEEQALGRRIARWRRRVRWALYTSPIALPTLRKIWHRVEHEDISLHEIVQHHEGTTPDQTTWRAQCRQAILSLQELAIRLGRSEAHSGMPRQAVQERRGLCHERLSLWRAWLTTWEALQIHVIERKSKLHGAMTRLWASHGRAPSVYELSSALGWRPQEVEELLVAVQPIAQLQQPVTDDGDALQDVLEDTQAPQPDELVAEEQLRRGVGACLGRLTEREALILRLRYGLDMHEPHSLQEIGEFLGISRERVRQVEKQAFTKLRRSGQSALLAELVQ